MIQEERKRDLNPGENVESIFGENSKVIYALAKSN